MSENQEQRNLGPVNMEEIIGFLKMDETSEVQESNREDCVPCGKLEGKKIKNQWRNQITNYHMLERNPNSMML